MNPIKIYKVGGVVLGDPSGFLQFTKLVKSENKPAIFVISAFNLTTRELKNAALIAESKDFKSAKIAIDLIFKKHFQFAETNIPNLIKPIKKSLLLIKKRALRLIRGVSLTGYLSNKTLDSILAIGEELALTLISINFSNNPNIQIIDSSQLIVTDNCFAQANIIPELCEEKINEIKPLLKQNIRIITQGFTAKSFDGHITTMGLESSNLTATILADILNVKELVIQTNVDGIYNADPNKFNSVNLIEFMNYNFAKSAAMNGLKLIYGDMIDIAKKKNIRIIFESGLNQSSTHTQIDNSDFPTKPLVIVQSNIGLVRIQFNSYKERRYLIDKLLNDSNIRSKVIYSNLMEDYVEFVLKDDVTDFQNNFSEVELFLNLTLIKILNSNQILKLQDLLLKYKDSIITGVNFINSDNNVRLLLKENNSYDFVNEILAQENNVTN